MATMSKAAFAPYILKQEPGKLWLKLREEFDTSTMEMHHTMACISRSAVKVIKTDSKGEISSTDMLLSAKEFAILAEGFKVVQHFWNEQELPERHVLLGCGCIIDWKETDTSSRCHQDLPFEDAWVYCQEHEDVRIYRFNISDFIEIGKEQPNEKRRK